MSNNFDFNDPIITRRRKGTSDDAFISKNETLTIHSTSYTVVLTEIPDKFQRV